MQLPNLLTLQRDDNDDNPTVIFIDHIVRIQPHANRDGWCLIFTTDGETFSCNITPRALVDEMQRLAESR